MLGGSNGSKGTALPFFSINLFVHPSTLGAMVFAAMSALAMDSMGHIVGEGPLINAEKACLVGEVHRKASKGLLSVKELHSICHYPCCM